MLGSCSLTLMKYALVIVALVVAETTARAQSRYDGVWSVSLITNQGSCGHRDIEVRVSNGKISHFGDQGFFTASGEVGEEGRVEASIGALGIWASAQGRLSEFRGLGSWVLPERGCSGKWVADRLDI